MIDPPKRERPLRGGPSFTTDDATRNDTPSQRHSQTLRDPFRLTNPPDVNERPYGAIIRGDRPCLFNRFRTIEECRRCVSSLGKHGFLARIVDLRQKAAS